MFFTVQSKNFKIVGIKKQESSKNVLIRILFVRYPSVSSSALSGQKNRKLTIFRNGSQFLVHLAFNNIDLCLYDIFSQSFMFYSIWSPTKTILIIRLWITVGLASNRINKIKKLLLFRGSTFFKLSFSWLLDWKGLLRLIIWV